ncbi:MAG: hypothetical protein WCC04_08250 [Terriglobales bacterium]
MNRRGDWLGLSIGLLVLACPPTLFSQNTDCTAQGFRALPSNAPVYREAAGLSATLSKNGILVKCISGSPMEGTFEGQSGAAVYRTVHGSFQVLFLPQTRTFDRLKIIEQHNGDRYLYRFQGPPQPWPANLIDTAFRIYFVKDRNFLFVVDGDAELAAKLTEFVHSQH